jgi:hypothetical protein
MDATEVREHIKFLSAKGIGLGAVANQVGTSRATIQYIKRGKFANITTALGTKILAVPAIPRQPMAYTDAKPIHDLLKKLAKHGVTEKDVGRILGCRYGALKVGTKIRVWRFNQIEAACKDLLRKFP